MSDKELHDKFMPEPIWKLRLEVWRLKLKLKWLRMTNVVLRIQLALLMFVYGGKRGQ